MNEQKISGRVQAENAAPVSGVTVEISWPTKTVMKVLDGRTAITDEHGLWSVTIPAEADEEFYITIRHQHHYSDKPAYWPSLDDLTSGSFIITTHQGLSVEGIVRNESGSPVENAIIMPPDSVRAVNAQTGLRESAQTARSDNRGHFVLHGVKPGQQNVFTDADGYSVTLTSVDVSPSTGQLEIVLKKGSYLSGRVVDQDQRPIGGVEIKADHGCKDRHADCRNMVQFIILRRQTITDENGCFALDDMPLFGSLQILANKRKGPFNAFFDYIDFPHPDPVTITLFPSPSMTGLVLDDQTDRPITDFTITPGFKFSNCDEKRFYDARQVSSPTGTFTETDFHVMSGFNPPQITARIEAPGYQPYLVEPLDSNLVPNPVIIRLKKL